MAPIDLQAEFGRRWRIEEDESAGGRLRDPWLATIPCRHGHLFAAGPDSIGAATNRPGAIVRKLRSIPGVELVADGSDGANLIFGRAALPSVARVMKPRYLKQTITISDQNIRECGPRTPSGSPGGGLA